MANEETIGLLGELDILRLELAECRNTTAKIRVALPAIEQAQVRGWELNEIVETLNLREFRIENIFSFKTLLHRVRDERSLVGKKPSRRSAVLRISGNKEVAKERKVVESVEKAPAVKLVKTETLDELRERMRNPTAPDWGELEEN